ncbi:MAG TPA: YciI family protein [Polyangiaceae bacterium]
MPTQKYLCIQRSVPGKKEPPTKAQMQEMMASFNAWRQKFSAQIVDLGGKLESGGKIVTATGVSDGPFIEAKEIIGGYMIIAADSFEQALEIARQSPGVLMPGSSVEVRKIATS